MVPLQPTEQQPIRGAKVSQQPPFQLVELIERKTVLEENEPWWSILHSVCLSARSWHWIMCMAKCPAETIRIINATFLPTAQNGVSLRRCVWDFVVQGTACSLHQQMPYLHFSPVLKLANEESQNLKIIGVKIWYSTQTIIIYWCQKIYILIRGDMWVTCFYWNTFFSPNMFVFFSVYLKTLLKDFVLICLLALALKLECFRDVIADRQRNSPTEVYVRLVGRWKLAVLILTNEFIRLCPRSSSPLWY